MKLANKLCEYCNVIAIQLSLAYFLATRQMSYQSARNTDPVAAHLRVRINLHSIHIQTLPLQSGYG